MFLKMGEQFLFRYCWFNLFRGVQFLQKLFDTLISYIDRVLIKFENTSQVFYFYMKILQTGTNFVRVEQKRVG